MTSQQAQPHDAKWDFASESEINQICQRIDSEAIKSAGKTPDPAERLKWLQISQSVRTRCKTLAEENDTKLEAQNRKSDVAHERSRFIATSIVPAISVFIAMVALVFQANQFKKSSDTQARQSEDERWGESMKAVSLADPKASIVGALAMQTFFPSQRYGKQSQMIAAALLPNVKNVTGFDEVLDDLIQSVPADGQYLVTGIGSMLLMAAREEHHLKGAILESPSETPVFLEHDVLSIDPNPDLEKEGELMQDKIYAWELDSVSQGLTRLWRMKKLTPDRYLVSIVLENASFAQLDFSNVDFERSVFLDADFSDAKLTNVNLNQTSFRNVSLKGADLSGIMKFDGSTWQNVDWWHAKCLSPQIYDYLAVHSPIPQSQFASVPSRSTLTTCVSTQP